MESWSATERVFRELRSLSPLTTLLGRAFAAGYAESKRLRGEEVPLTFFAVMLAGYAARSLFVDIIGQPLLDPHTPPLDQLVGRDYDYEDPDTNVAAIELLRDPVFQLVFADFGTVMTLSPELWAGYISLATMQLQANLKSRAVPARYLDRECIEGMLRYGYVLRCVDEALGAEPDPPRALGRSARARTRWGVLTDRPLSAHSDDELADVLWQGARVEWKRIGDLDVEIDRQLFCGPAVLFGEPWSRRSAVEMDLAATMARVGCLIRVAELELFDDAWDRECPEWGALAQIVADLMRKVLDDAEDDDAGSGAGIEGEGVGVETEGEGVEAEGVGAGAGTLTKMDRVTMRTAHVFASDSESVDTLLESTPGPSRAVREKTFERWLGPAEAEGAVPPDLDREQLSRLVAYGYAVMLTREILGHFNGKGEARQD